MRLALLCGGLEPGRDGVGDYSRQLGAELESHGHEVMLMALNDRWHKGPVAQQPPVLRFGDFTPVAWRAEAALALLKSFGPDWVSLQYVCYAYHPKGLAWNWNPVFAKLGATARRRHLMLHELWSGEGGHPPWRHRLMGLGQQWCIRNLHRRLRPDVVTTSIPLFKRRLARRGITSALLPLFGNIRVAPRNDAGIVALLEAAGSRLARAPRQSFLNGVFFGTVHPDFDVTPLTRWLAQLQQRAGRRMLLSMIGRTGLAAKRIAPQLKNLLPGVEVILLAEQPESVISQALQFADFGINTGAPEFLGKSGTFAAMRDHGLPVVIADGEIDSQLLSVGAPPVLQFSAANSIAAMLKCASVAAERAGAALAAVDLLNLFGQTTGGNGAGGKP